jgi:hypothetical protein
MHTDPHLVASRRSFLRAMALGGAAIAMPSLITACGKDGDGGLPVGPGNGADIDFDLATDAGLLRFAYAAEQLRADYYLHLVPFLDDGAYSDEEQRLLTDVKYHSVMHREFLKASLASGTDFTLTFDYGTLDFSNRAAFLSSARELERLGVAMYNGLAQYFTVPANLVMAAKMASVRARHASALGAMIDPAANAFAPAAYADVMRPATVEAALQAYVVQDIQLTNAPAAFVPGPNGTA